VQTLHRSFKLSAYGAWAAGAAAFLQVTVIGLQQL